MDDRSVKLRMFVTVGRVKAVLEIIPIAKNMNVAGVAGTADELSEFLVILENMVIGRP